MPPANSLEAAITEPASQVDAAAFHRDGFVVCRWPLFTPVMLARLRSIAEEYVGEVAAGRRSADLNQPHFSDLQLFDFLLSGNVLDVVELLLGSDILLWSSQFFCKPPYTGASVPWHADGYYWKWFINPVRVVSIFVALDEQTTGNGCLRVIPGSHRHPQAFAYRRARADANPFFPRGVPADMLHSAKIIDINLRAGEFVLFDAWLLHGSAANRSPSTRYSFTMRYAPTTCRVDAISVQLLRRCRRMLGGVVRRTLLKRDIYRHQVYLARGKDHAGNLYHPLPSPKA